MNERIKELYEQAHIEHRQEYVSSTMKSVSVTRQFDPELFVELIVRECAQVCRDQPDIYALKADRDNCAIAIENHFGVEE